MSTTASRMGMHTEPRHSNSASRAPQATSEQIRLARLTETRSVEIEISQENIKNVVDCTKCSVDAATIALQDCDHDVQLAITQILDGSQSGGEWITQSKGKKQKKTSAQHESSAYDVDDTEQLDKDDRTSQRRKDQPPRFSRGGRGGSRGGGHSRGDRVPGRNKENENFGGNERGQRSGRGRSSSGRDSMERTTSRGRGRGGGFQSWNGPEGGRSGGGGFGSRGGAGDGTIGTWDASATAKTSTESNTWNNDMAKDTGSSQAPQSTGQTPPQPISESNTWHNSMAANIGRKEAARQEAAARAAAVQAQQAAAPTAPRQPPSTNKQDGAAEWGSGGAKAPAANQTATRDKTSVEEWGGETDWDGRALEFFSSKQKSPAPAAPQAQMDATNSTAHYQRPGENMSVSALMNAAGGGTTSESAALSTASTSAAAPVSASVAPSWSQQATNSLKSELGIGQAPSANALPTTSSHATTKVEMPFDVLGGGQVDVQFGFGDLDNSGGSLGAADFGVPLSTPLTSANQLYQQRTPSKIDQAVSHQQNGSAAGTPASLLGYSAPPKESPKATPPLSTSYPGSAPLHSAAPPPSSGGVQFGGAQGAASGPPGAASGASSLSSHQGPTQMNVSPHKPQNTGLNNSYGGGGNGVSAASSGAVRTLSSSFNAPPASDASTAHQPPPQSMATSDYMANQNFNVPPPNTGTNVSSGFSLNGHGSNNIPKSTSLQQQQQHHNSVSSSAGKYQAPPVSMSAAQANTPLQYNPIAYPAYSLPYMAVNNQQEQLLSQMSDAMRMQQFQNLGYGNPMGGMRPEDLQQALPYLGNINLQAATAAASANFLDLNTLTSALQPNAAFGTQQQMAAQQQQQQQHAPVTTSSAPASRNDNYSHSTGQLSSSAEVKSYGGGAGSAGGGSGRGDLANSATGLPSVSGVLAAPPGFSQPSPSNAQQAAQLMAPHYPMMVHPQQYPFNPMMLAGINTGGQLTKSSFDASDLMQGQMGGGGDLGKGGAGGGSYGMGGSTGGAASASAKSMQSANLNAIDVKYAPPLNKQFDPNKFATAATGTPPPGAGLANVAGFFAQMNAGYPPTAQFPPSNIYHNAPLLSPQLPAAMTLPTDQRSGGQAMKQGGGMQAGKPTPASAYGTVYNTSWGGN